MVGIDESKNAQPADETEPRVLKEPGSGGKAGGEALGDVPAGEIDDDFENPWMRGLWMVVLAILFGVGQTILLIAAVLQFLWLLFRKEKNENIADFGEELSDWLARVALFQTGATEDKPFPFSRWGAQAGARSSEPSD